LVDLARIKQIPYIKEIIKGDITKLSTITQLQNSLRRNGSEEKEMVVLADCSPNLSGAWITDRAKQIWLAEVALGISNFFLAEKFLTKVFQGEFFQGLFKKIKISYKNVKSHKPKTSRKGSAEMYIVATERKNKGVQRYNRQFLLLEE